MTLSHFVLALASYLAGSIPFGLMIGRVVKGIDLRDHGSGNIGATNAGRVLGTKWGLICLVLDALKGFLPVALFPRWICGADAPLDDLAVLAGVATIVGHMFPCWLGFRGGKGVATSLGVVAMLSPWGLLVGAVAFFSTFAIFRIVSLSSILAAVGFGLFYLTPYSLTPYSRQSMSLGLFSAAVPLLIVFQHRSNVKRLLRGEEPRFAAKPESAVKPDAVQESSAP